MKNRLFEFTMRVLRAEGCDLPDGAQGAYVPCYASAPDYRSAVKNGVAAIRSMHYRFDDVRGNVREIPGDTWAAYVAQVWPEFAEHMPSQTDISDLIAKGSVFFGPFATFKQ